MNPADSYHHIVQVVRRAKTANGAWVRLLSHLEGILRAPRQCSLNEVSIDDDVAQVRSALRALLRTDRPPRSIDAIYFGLFDGVDEAGTEGVGYYVCGVSNFDPNDGDSLCDPAWWPDHRYLDSRALAAVKRHEVQARLAKRLGDAQVFGYTGQLGAALILTKFASRGLFGKRQRVVGFDSGDIAVLD